MKFFAILLIFYSFEFNYAQTCASLFNGTKKNTIYRESDSLLADNDYQGIIESIQSISPNLVHPIQFKVFIRKNDGDFVDMATQSIYTVANYELPILAENKVALINSFIHEYSHALFEVNLEQLSLGKTVNNKNILEIDSEINKAKLELSELIKKGKVEQDPIKEAEIFQLANSLLKKIERLKILGLNEVEKSKLIAAIHELFSDVITVILTNDPNAISKSVYASNSHRKVNPPDILASRTFTVNDSTVNNWGTDKYIYLITESEHVALNPVRWEFWRVFKDRIRTHQDKVIAIDFIFKTLANELRFIDSLKPEEIGSRAFKGEKIDELNLRLTSEIKNFR